MSVVVDLPKGAAIDRGFDDLLEYLGPLGRLISDPEVSEIFINADLQVYAEIAGKRQAYSRIELDRKSVEAAARRIARANSQELSDKDSICYARLPDGSRVTIIGPPASPHGLTMTIRKFQKRYFTLPDLIECGTLNANTAHTLQEMVLAKQNILVSGATGAGKTSLLNALLRLIGYSDRIVLIEKPSEIQIDHPDVVRLEASEPITQRELVKAAMRLSPDRIVVGEVRGEEALDMLQALNSGHLGSFTTIHANSALLALSKLMNYALRGATAKNREESKVDYLPIRREIAECIHCVVQLVKQPEGKRVVSEVIRVTGYDASIDRFETEAV